jgi:enoyl-CoA hydratase
MSDLIQLERLDAGVVLLVLNRPEARNAMNSALAAATVEALHRCKDDRAIVLTGADPAFCAGLDLKDLGVDELRQLPPFLDAVASSPVPVIAAVNGAAVTGGLELALAADFIVASDRALFADTHLRVNVYPGPVAVDLPRRVGLAFAREMSLTGNFVDAATALRVGLANHVVAHDELIPHALTLAAAIAEQDPETVRLLREDWRASSGAPYDEAHQIHSSFARRSATGRTASGLAARRDAVIERAHDQTRP